MNCIIYLVILAVVAGTSLAANSTGAYVDQWNRKYQSYIKTADSKIECVDGRAADSIRVIKDQQEEVLKEIQRYQDSLIPLEALSLNQKNCIQKYSPMLISYESALEQFSYCTTVAQTKVDSLTALAKASSAMAKKEVNVNLPNTLSNCKTNNSNNQAKSEECIIKNVDYYTTDIQTEIRTVDKNLDASLCSLTDLTRDAIDCSFAVEHSVLVTMGKVMNLIETCLAEKRTVCPCA